MKLVKASSFKEDDKGFLVYLSLEELLVTAAVTGWVDKFHNQTIYKNIAWWQHTGKLLHSDISGHIPGDLMKVLPNPYTKDKTISPDWTVKLEYLNDSLF